MKLKRLIITGFGPYAAEQTLDFEEALAGKTMFVITGNTGAGKTTIFDAVAFALFGEASGSVREGKSLRSHFATDDMPTQVELVFSVRGTEYRVIRSPEYLTRKKRGEGQTKHAAAAELHRGDTIVTGIKQVTQAVEEILGITAEQFRQLVMIPQGEFSRMMQAKSDEKEDMFRRLFGTQLFSMVQERIKRESLELEKSFAQIRRDRENKLREAAVPEDNAAFNELLAADTLNHEAVMTALADVVRADTAALTAAEKAVADSQKQRSELAAEQSRAAELQRRFDDLTRAQAAFNSLEQQRADMKTLRERMANAERAAQVEPLGAALQDAMQRMTRLDGDIASLNEQMKTAREALAKADAAVQTTASAEPRARELQEEITRLDALQKKASDHAAAVKEMTETDARLAKGRAMLETAQKELRVAKEQLEKTDASIASLGAQETEREKLIAARDAVKQRAEALAALRESGETYLEQEKLHAGRAAAHDALERRFHAAKLEYEDAETRFRLNQAGILAARLTDGEPCPVCGSREHPHRAVMPAGAPDEARLEALRAAHDAARDARDTSLNELTAIKSSMDMLWNASILPGARHLFETFSGDAAELLKRTASEYAATNALLKQHDSALTDSNRTIAAGAELRARREKELPAISDTEKRIDDFQNRMNELRAVRAAAAARAEELMRDIPASIGSFDAIAPKLDALKTEAEAIARARDEAMKSHRDAENAVKELGGNLSARQAEQSTAAKEQESAAAAFRAGLAAQGFADEATYRAAVVPAAQILQMRDTVSRFDQDLAVAQESVRRLSAELADQSPPDTAGIAARIREADALHAQRDAARLALHTRVSRNRDIIAAVERMTGAMPELERRYAIIGTLSKLVNGDNPRRLSLERFVLSAYFDDIIEAANIRLRTMAANRYKLVRMTAAGDMRSQQGLDLEVFDSYTGRARTVKTLSGGETFKASLAMALGLADVVQAHAGGVQLDTMFIDEGFGTLDADSLDAAIDCLAELNGDGRLVGIISHVDELKNRIDAKLVVTADNTGSYAEFRV